MENHCQLPILNKKTGEITTCEDSSLQIFTYEGNDFYFCPEHYKIFSENIDNLYKALQKEVEESMDKL
jgi:hypothetical protein